MDPITTTILAVLSAGAAGMAAQASEVGKMVAKNAYEALKAALGRKFGKESKLEQAITTLESEPAFKPYQDALALRVRQTDAAADAELLKLARVLAHALEQTCQGREVLKRWQLSIRDSEVGVVGDHARVEGGIHFGKE